MAGDKEKLTYSRGDQRKRTLGAETGKKSVGSALSSKNKMSSARGPYQILDGTWKELEKSAGRKLDRNSEDDNNMAFELYTKKSEKALEQNGIEINPGNTYALHVFGQAGGVDYLKKMKSNPEGLSIDGMPASVVKGNKPFFYDESGKPRTNLDSYKKISSRVGGPDDPGAITAQKDNRRQAVIEQIKSQQAQRMQSEQQAQIQNQEQQQFINPEDIAQEAQQEPAQQEIQQAPISELSSASNSAGLMYSGNPGGKFILPKQEEAVDGVKTSGEASMKAKTFGDGGKIDPNKKPVLATRNDSIVLRDDSRRMLKEYEAKGYERTDIAFPDSNLDGTLSAMQNRKGVTQVIRNGVRKPEKYNPAEYRQNINENQFRQREAANGVLNMDITPALYDKRVNPTSYLKLMGEQGGTYGDGVNVPYYGDMEISPKAPVVKAGVTPTATPVVKKQVVPIPAKAPTPVVKATPRRNPYAQTAVPFQRDNTRVGTSFETVDPKIIKKASMFGFADGGELNDGLLNDFNVGGTHEENPNGGINQGVSGDGSQNTVEEGETRMGDYIFSDRLKLDKADVENLYLPKEVVGMTYADASKFINEFLEENPFDIIIKRTAQSQLDSLKVGNDRARKFKEAEETVVSENEQVKQMRFSGSEQPEEELAAQQAEESIASEEQEQATEEPIEQPKMAFGGRMKYSRSNRYVDGTELDLAETGTGPGAVAYVGTATTALSMGMDAFQKYDTADLDNKIVKQKAGLSAAKGAASGAAAGAAFGPWGAGAGALVGGAMGFIGAKRANKAANEQDINITGRNFNNMFGEMAPTTVSAAYGGSQYSDGGNMDVPREKKGSYPMFMMTDPYANTKVTRFAPNFSMQIDRDLEKVKNAPKAQLFFQGKSVLSQQTKDGAAIQKSAIDNRILNNSTDDSFVNKSKGFQVKNDSPLKYAGAVGALSNYVNSRKEKARNIKSEELTKTSSPNYFDESIIDNKMTQEMNNRSQAILATSGGSAASARAMQFANSSEVNKLKSESYFKMFEENNTIRDRDQVETQRISDANTGIRNQDYQANLQEQDYVQGRKDKARDNLYSSVEAIGQEQSDKNLVFNLSGGYKGGNYDPEDKTGINNMIANAFRGRNNRKSSGGIIDYVMNYEKVQDEKRNKIEEVNRKYNG